MWTPNERCYLNAKVPGRLATLGTAGPQVRPVEGRPVVPEDLTRIGGGPLNLA